MSDHSRRVGAVPAARVGRRSVASAPMEQRALGRSGLVVSRLGLGTATWGRDTDEDDAAAQLVAFREAGGTLLDVAPERACEPTEPLVGRLVQDVVPRSELVLAAKAGGAAGSGGGAPRARR